MSNRVGRCPKRKAALACTNALSKHTRRPPGVPTTATTCAPVSFSGIELPSTILPSILGYLPQPEIVHHASLVNSAWRHASHSPTLWDTLLDDDLWKTTYAKKQKRVLDVLKRPQFVQLKAVSLPRFQRTKSDHFWRQLAKSFPHLQELHAGGITVYNHEFPNFPTWFPKLNRLTVDLEPDMDEAVFVDCIRRFEVPLEELDIKAEDDLLSSDGLLAVGLACPDLEYFSYATPAETLGCTAQAVWDFAISCPKLYQVHWCMRADCSLHNKTLKRELLDLFRDDGRLDLDGCEETTGTETELPLPLIFMHFMMEFAVMDDSDYDYSDFYHSGEY